MSYLFITNRRSGESCLDVFYVNLVRLFYNLPVNVNYKIVFSARQNTRRNFLDKTFTIVLIARLFRKDCRISVKQVIPWLKVEFLLQRLDIFPVQCVFTVGVVLERNFEPFKGLISTRTILPTYQ